jgi:peptide/nickel transport system substrate-binding protein
LRRLFNHKIVIVLLLIILVSTPVFAKHQPSHTTPGPAIDRIIFKGGIPVDVAPKILENKEIDLYLSSLKIEGARELIGKSSVRILQAPASSISIVLNPAPAPSGQLNPFSIQAVRFALNYMINRDFVVNEIYKGLAVPMVTHISPFDFDYLGVSDIITESNIRYDPDFAKRLVSDAMKQAGAIFRDNQWFYNDRPILLKFIIRVEDERREIGDLVAAELRKLGFTVNTIFQPFGPAISSVYGSDPQVFEWHLYTEGWGRGGSERYDFATLNQMCAPWLGNMPGWKETGFWQYENSQLDEIGQRIFTGNFSNVIERNSLYKEGTRICLNEAVRLWVSTVVNSFPISSLLQSLSLDVVSGPRSLTTLREAFFPDKNELTIGNIWVWTPRTIWNPIGGFVDVYSVDIWRNLFDPPTWRHPFTGLPIPFRTAYDVETAGPSRKLSVPFDAVLWDAQVGAWKEVGQGTRATSKVTFNYEKYFSSNWHHNQRITMADFFYSIYQMFDLTYNPNKSKVEFSIATVNRPYLDTFRGFRILNDTSVEVYVDFWHFVPDYIAEYASLTNLSMPWEVLSAMDNLVFEQRRLAYSDTAAARFGVDWLSLVEGTHARLLKQAMNEFLDEKLFPEEVFRVSNKVLANANDATARYNAAIAWFDEHGQMVISNGPFMLITFDARSQFAEIRAFRDTTYPFKKGDWFYGEPPSIEILKVEGNSISAGKETQFKIDVKGPGELNLNYILFDPAKGILITKGDARRVTNSSFIVTLPADLTSKLQPGRYQLSLSAFSDAISIIARQEKLLDTRTIVVIGTGNQIITNTTTKETASAQDSTIFLIAGGIAAAIVTILFIRKRKELPGT